MRLGVTALTLAGPDAKGLVMQRDWLCEGTGYRSRARVRVKGLGMNHGLGYWLDKARYVRKAGLMALGLLGADGYKSPAISPCVYSSSRNVLYLN